MPWLTSATSVSLYAFDTATMRANVIDTATSVDGLVVFDSVAPSQIVGIASQDPSAQFQYVLFVEKEDLQITYENKNYPQDVKGSASMEQLAIFDKNFKNNLQLPYEELAKTLRMATNENAPEAEIQKIKDDMDKIREEYEAAIVGFIQKNKDKDVAAYILGDRLSQPKDNQTAIDMYGILSESVKASYFGRNYKPIVEAMMITAVGSEAPEFTLPNQAGESVSLSSMRGKPVVVNVWTLQCVPCIDYLSGVSEAVSAASKENIELVSILFLNDPSKKSEVSTYVNDDWVQLSGDRQMVSQYGLRTLPFMIILDKEGKIVAKNPAKDKISELLQPLM